ncbi:MAG TPA: DUF3348 domain-containing protein [Rhodocyclaceae bacterium]|nr:DUF3348 domain-containing protein [Rhodocyclaceae bacterium]
MAASSPRTSFSSPKLLRLLDGLGVADVDVSKLSFAERLGQWMDITDSISLSAALKANVAGKDVPAGGDMAAELARVRKTLTDSILAEKGLRVAEAADFTPFHRYHTGLQRDMEAGIGALRAKVRAALTGRSPSQGRLAALDAALEQSLQDKERNFLATVPWLLEKRFNHLRKADQEASGWLEPFRREMQEILLAELDLRLQPVEGLVEALSNEVTKHP